MEPSAHAPASRPAPLLKRRKMLGLGVLAALAGGIGWHIQTTVPVFSGATLSAAEAQARAQAGEILLVDIRRPDEWRRTGLGAGAHPLDMRRDDFTQTLAALSAANPGRPVALICAGGVRSARLANRLDAAGLGPILDVPEGMEGSAAGPGWIKSGLPTIAWNAAG